MGLRVSESAGSERAHYVRLLSANSYMNLTNERRRKARSALRCRVLFFRRACSAPIADGVTQNLSSGGFYCVSPVPLAVGESLACLLKMPSDEAALTLECLIRVVRVEEGDEEGSFGIGCQIEDYHACSAERRRYMVRGV